MSFRKQVAFICASLSVFSALVTPGAKAQFSYRRTVGDESENQYQHGNFQAVRYRGSIIGNPSLRSNNADAGNFTRHSRIGNSTGIGGSTLQTTSVTSESRPALLRPSSISTGTPLLTRPVLDVRFESASQSPALRRFQIQSPSFEDGNAFGRAPETFTSASSWSSLNSSFSSVDDFQFGQ